MTINDYLHYNQAGRHIQQIQQCRLKIPKNIVHLFYNFLMIFVASVINYMHI